MQYVYWVGETDNMAFYNVASVRQLYFNHLKALINRVNSFTGELPEGKISCFRTTHVV